MALLSKYSVGNSHWLKSEDLSGWEGPTIIQFADEYEVKDQNGKTDMKAGFTFTDFNEKPYLTNVTNARRIEAMVVKQKGIPAEKIELKDTIGIKLWLYTEATQTPSGSQTMGIRVKEIPPNFAAAEAAGHGPAPGPAGDEPPPPTDDDSVPF